MPLQIHPYLQPLQTKFQAAADPEIARQQKAYLRDQFEYFGIKTPGRRVILKEFVQKYGLPDSSEITAIVKSGWAQPEREYQHFILDLLMKKLKVRGPEFVPLCEFLITHKSWWDTVDMLASDIIGRIFFHHPELREPYSRKWTASENMWLNRTSILFQLMYKDKTDKALLFQNILANLPSDEFFIQKAIGWVLRQYSKTNPEAVENFVKAHDLPPLSKREALRIIKS